MAPQPRKRLLLVKGSFEPFGGGERDLLNSLPGWMKFFDISVATLNPNQELVERLEELKIPLFTPTIPWQYSKGILSEILATSSRSATKKWYSMLSLTKQGPGLNMLFSNINAVNVTSGMASLEIIPFLPKNIPLHLYMHEPNRGLHSNDLHFEIDGTPKNNLRLTNILLNRQRRIDEKLVSLAAKRGMISGNSINTTQRIKEVYSLESNVLYPSINQDIWPHKPSEDEDWPGLKKRFDLTENKYIITIGHAIFAKGLWNTIKRLSGSELELIQVGGGVTKKHHDYADKNNVKLKPLPRVSQPELRALMRNARAMVSNAINEPFGLTPPESYFVDCPVVVSNQGGFKETVIDNQTGRLLNDDDDLLEAIEQAHNNRTQWSIAGREHIEKMDLSTTTQGGKVYTLLSNQFEEE